MSAQNHYETLGVDDNSSFEEIQDARNRLIQECGDNHKRIEAVEAAYDAILMERLRMRQEGKIKVPDRIRFPERLVEPLPKSFSASPKQTPDWVQRFLDNPSRSEILWPAAAFSIAALLSAASPSVGLALGVILALFFLNRKEHKFGRALLLTLVSLLLGVLGGVQLGQIMQSQLQALSISVEGFAAIATNFIFWLVSSFLR